MKRPEPIGAGYLVFWLLALPSLASAIPATPLMTVYKFNGPAEVPYYRVDDFAQRAKDAPVAGTLSQGTSVIPCLVVRRGRVLTDSGGTPYVGFEVVLDARKAGPGATERFQEVVEQRRRLRTTNHHCRPGVPYVMDVRSLYPMGKAPKFDPPDRGSGRTNEGRSELDSVIRAFHDSPQCQEVQRRLVGRRKALGQAWSAFAKQNRNRWPAKTLERARHLDYTMRTTLLEGHVGRGCSAYGACERAVIALSIANRARRACARRQGCRYEGDFEGVASKVSQYNIWDETLTQVTRLTACFLRADLAHSPPYGKLQAMYVQSLPDVTAILFGGSNDLTSVFARNQPSQLKSLRHYYHPPAMGKCFPEHPRVEYISGAVAQRDRNYALIANTRVEVGKKGPNGYSFRSFAVEDELGEDRIRITDDHSGFSLDPRKVELKKPKRCSAYGTPPECRFEAVARYRRTPPWLSAGQPLSLTCEVLSTGNSCREKPRRERVAVGGRCDTEMQPIRGVH